VIGNTNAGKSTLLNNITGMTNFFNTSQMRETSSLWTFKLDKDQLRPYRITVLEAVTDNPEEKRTDKK
jgi:GTP-binding protein EngB required for normal cell division